MRQSNSASLLGVWSVYRKVMQMDLVSTHRIRTLVPLGGQLFRNGRFREISAHPLWASHPTTADLAITSQKAVTSIPLKRIGGKSCGGASAEARRAAHFAQVPTEVFLRFPPIRHNSPRGAMNDKRR